MRERSRLVYEKAREGKTKHFDVDWAKLDETVMWVVGIVKVSYILCNSKVLILAVVFFLAFFFSFESSRIFIFFLVLSWSKKNRRLNIV